MTTKIYKGADEKQCRTSTRRRKHQGDKGDIASTS